MNASASCLSKQDYASSAPFPVRGDAEQAERCCLKHQVSGKVGNFL